jgi:uncharacterized protein
MKTDSSVPFHQETTVVKTREDIKLQDPTIVAGFSGAGLVGSIAANQLIESLKMHEIAHIRSPYVPPGAIFIAGKLRHPFRIYAQADGKTCVAVCEIPLFLRGLFEISNAFLDWAEANNAKEIIVADGIGVEAYPSERKTYCVAEDKRCDELKSKGLERLPKAFIPGIAGSLLAECLTRSVTGVAFLIPALRDIPDPEGAASIIESLNKAYNWHISTESLHKEADTIKGQLEELAKRYGQEIPTARRPQQMYR